MCIKQSGMAVEYREKPCGRDGTARVTRLAPAGMLRHANLFSKIRLPPGAALAYHRHDGETEYCVFMSETGVVADDVRERMSAPGDVTVTGSCCPHSLANESGEDLLLYAMIIVD